MVVVARAMVVVALEMVVVAQVGRPPRCSAATAQKRTPRMKTAQKAHQIWTRRLQTVDMVVASRTHNRPTN